MTEQRKFRIGTSGMGALSWVPLACLAATAPRAQTAADVLAQTGVKYGLAVHLGATDGTLETGLTNNNSILVQGLALDPKTVFQARQQVRQAGKEGMVTIERALTFAKLPYATNLVNLLVADLDALGAQAPSDAEIQRVLEPNGVAYVKKGGQWAKTVKARPAGMDDASHWNHNADHNSFSKDDIGLVNSIQWTNGPVDNMDAYSSTVFENGLGFVHTYDGAGWPAVSLRGFDAFNGLPIWRVMADSKVKSMGRGGFTGGGYYFGYSDAGYITALDAVTGKLARTFTKGFAYNDQWGKPGGPQKNPRYVYFDGKLLEANKDTLIALDVNTGDVAWRHVEPGLFHTMICAEAGRVYALVDKAGDAQGDQGDFGNDYGSDPNAAIIALDSKDGHQLWRNTEGDGKWYTHFAAGEGLVVAFHHIHNNGQGNKSAFRGDPVTMCDREVLHVLDGATGKTRFMKLREQLPNTDTLAYNLANNVGVREGKVYILGHAWIFGYDGNTGAKVLDAQTGWDFTCMEYLGSKKWFLNSSQRMVDGDGKIQMFDNLTRSICWGRQVTANNLLYTSAWRPNGSDANYAQASEAPVDTIPDGQRLEPGTVAAPAAAGKAWPRDDEWPLWRGNALRTASTKAPGPQGLKLVGDYPFTTPRDMDNPFGYEWSRNDYTSRITAPSIGDSAVYVAVPDANRVDAFNAATMVRKWSFTAGGRVDLPPTPYKGTVIFGGRDGWVYCLRASDGAVIWRFLASPFDRKMVSHGQLESVGMLNGSALIHKDALYVAAGRNTLGQAGMWLYKLDPATGALAWKARMPKTGGPMNANPAIRYNGQRLEPLEADSLFIYCGNQAVHPKLGVPRTVIKSGELKYSAANGTGLSTVSFKDLDPSYPQDALIGQIVPRDQADKYFTIGMLSNRTDYKGYGNDYRANQVAVADGYLYTAGLYYQNPWGKDANLACFKLDDKGVVVQPPVWNVPTNQGKITTFTGDRNNFLIRAIAVAGDKLYLAGQGNLPNAKAPTGFLDVYNTADGKLVAGADLGAVKPMNDGIAIAYGKLYLSTEEGTVKIYGNANDAVLAIKAPPKGHPAERAQAQAQAPAPAVQSLEALGNAYRGGQDNERAWYHPAHPIPEATVPAPTGWTAASAFPAPAGAPEAAPAPLEAAVAGAQAAATEAWVAPEPEAAPARKAAARKHADDGMLEVTQAAAPPEAKPGAPGARPLHGLLREVWYGLGGESLEDLLADAFFPARPSGSEYLAEMSQTMGGGNYGERLSGYVLAPKTGAYAFSLRATGEARLRLVAEGGKKDLLALEAGQPAGKVGLEKGKRYFVEVVHKQGAAPRGGVEVAWKLPGSRTLRSLDSRWLQPPRP